MNIYKYIKLFNKFIEIKRKNNIEYITVFINEYYNINTDMPTEFYKLILDRINKEDIFKIFNIVIKRNIYLLISYLKYDNEDILELDKVITAKQYYSIPKKNINKLIKLIKIIINNDKIIQDIDDKNKDKEKQITEFSENNEKRTNTSNNSLDLLLKEKDIWLLRRRPSYTDLEYRDIAYKIYISIGLDNGIDLLNYKYGYIDYDKIYFMFSKLDVSRDINEIGIKIFREFLFNNKKEYNNVLRMMLDGRFIDLFLNIDYFYNNIDYFIDRLGIKMSKIKVKKLLDDRYLSYDVMVPDISRELLDDMEESYYNKYQYLDTKKEDIYKKNYQVYNEYLRNKYKSSIPMIDIYELDGYMCEVLSLSDPRNLVLGYRAGNCFRINGEAATLFYSFLKSEHMRLISISTVEYKDFAMMLVMRNGNVLIGQGIEVSKRIPNNLKGKKLYDICRDLLKNMMEYMNLKGDHIVATIIGRTNENVDRYNNQILPFLINPILDDRNNYYNGIDNYQCLLDLYGDKNINDIRLYIPSIRYYDKRNTILRRGINIEYDSFIYREIEKRLISFRYLRMKDRNIDFEYYQRLLSHREIYTCCNKDFYIILFDDGCIDSYIFTDNEIATQEYKRELENIKDNIVRDKKYCRIKWNR